MGFDTPNQGDNVLQSSDVDHQQTTNRTHSGDSITPQSVSTEQIGSERLYAGAYDGDDADARLDNALSAVSVGDVIYLESAEYSTRTISQSEITLRGTSNSDGLVGSHIGADWEISGNSVTIIGLGLGNGQTLTYAGNFAQLERCAFGSVSITGNNVGIFNSRDVDVTYSSATSGGIADALYNNSTVTDNGSNTVGDIA